MAELHPTAIVDAGAELGENVTISPFAIIDGDVIIGDNTWIGPQVKVASGTRIGKNCQVHQGAVLGGTPQDFKFEFEETILKIGDHTIIREYCTLSRGTQDHWRTEVGSHCFLMAYVHVAHDCILGDHLILANAVNMAGHVQIHDYAGVGGLVPIHQFVRIGRHAFIGGGCRVPKDVPPYILAAGEPPRFAGINIVGLNRHGFGKEAKARLRKAYRILYRSNLNFSQAVTRIKEEFALEDEIKDVVDFVETSERGIVK
ncbi:MAG: acyl-ACP--UDP-N-acetylglucosamine O-acyltransferase [Planctomycetota bacterium]|jgi:UDP-N-acetylglucosamine acyltransferase